ncbi:hypothetical protein ABLN86_21765, partial [Mycobacterium tuberculosis]
MVFMGMGSRWPTTPGCWPQFSALPLKRRTKTRKAFHDKCEKRKSMNGVCRLNTKFDNLNEVH